MTAYPIALELLEAERERLARDHYDSAPANLDPESPAWMTCDGCARAYEVRAEIDALRKAGKA